MATRRLFKQVPKFTVFELTLAEQCAIDLWNGVNYVDGEEMEVSDEEFFIDFALPFYDLVKNQNTRNLITEFSIRRLIRVANLKALFRSANPTDFQAGIRCIANDIVPLYDGMISKTLNLTPTGYGTRALLELGTRFVTPIKAPTRNGNYRVPLASRVLFFAIPDMLLFNFSNELAEAMLFQKRPQAAIPFFMETLHTGLILNNGLHSMELPPPNIMGSVLYKKIQKTDWWQRRVLDLALLLHFGVVSARPQLHTKARQIVARKKTISTP